MGSLKGQNAPIIIGGILVGAALLLWMRSQGSQQVVSNQPALTLYPSSEADRSTVGNILNAVNALSQQNLPSSTPNPTPTSVGVTTPTNSQQSSWLGWSWNLPSAGNLGNGVSTPSGVSAPVANPGSWSGISSILAGANPNALVNNVVDIQGSAAVPNSAAPEQVATVSQYQALVLGQYAGGTGIHAIGAPVDVTRGSTPEDNQLTVDYLQSILKTGAYNPNLGAISSPMAVNSLLYSMTNDPKYLSGIHT